MVTNKYKVPAILWNFLLILLPLIQHKYSNHYTQHKTFQNTFINYRIQAILTCWDDLPGGFAMICELRWWKAPWMETGSAGHDLDEICPSPVVVLLHRLINEEHEPSLVSQRLGDLLLDPHPVNKVATKKCTHSFHLIKLLYSFPSSVIFSLSVAKKLQTVDWLFLFPFFTKCNMNIMLSFIFRSQLFFLIERKNPLK